MGKTFKDRRNWDRKQNDGDYYAERRFREANERPNRRHYEEVIDDDDLDVYDEYDLEFE